MKNKQGDLYCASCEVTWPEKDKTDNTATVVKGDERTSGVEPPQFWHRLRLSKRGLSKPMALECCG